MKANIVKKPACPSTNTSETYNLFITEAASRHLGNPFTTLILYQSVMYREGAFPYTLYIC